MSFNPNLIAELTLCAVLACWFIFAAIFLLRKKPPTQPEAKRDNVSLVGIILQGCAYGLVWFHPPHSPFLPHAGLWPLSVEIALAVFTVAAAAGSVWLVSSAVRTLGKQWAFAARLVEGHKLITEGPYRFLRNPIYSGMLGMLVATGLALEHWIRLAVALVLFALGTVIRVRSEEKLLRTAFGQEWDEYAKRVPAVLPGIF
ncbi:MAG: isoprenylcysteine carboxylmethyltransferase family protein [Candidatus Sulfotelmatobacter sp.]